MLERLRSRLTPNDEGTPLLDLEPEDPGEVEHDEPWPHDLGDEESAAAER